MMKRYYFLMALGAMLWFSSCGKYAGSSLHFDADSARVLIEQAIADSLIPGAVLCVVDEGEIVYLEAYGHRAIVPKHETMTTNTIFDLASVSKPVGAGTAMLLLCVRIVMKKDGRFRSQHISENKRMRQDGIHCANSQDREARRKNTNKIDVQNL